MKPEIARRWSLGESLKQIASALGVTRGVIAGHITRMRENGVDIPKHTHVNKPRKPKVSQQQLPRLYGLQQRQRVEATTPSTETAVTILELQAWHCRAVVDGRRHNLPLYCGQQKLDDSSYCSEHAEKYSGGRLR